jgi:hypothetical protein
LLNISAQFLDFSAQFLAAPKTAPNLPKMAGAPYGIYGAPLLTPKSVLQGDIAVILRLSVMLMGMVISISWRLSWLF